VTWDLRDVIVFGPALSDPFLRFELEAVLAGRNPVLEPGVWDALRRQLRALGGVGGPLRVHNHVIAPLAAALGYDTPVRQEPVATREGLEDGGWLMQAAGAGSLRAWSVGRDTHLDAPNRRGRAYRFSPTRAAQRVLLVTGERAGLLTDGEQLRLLLSDPARPDSHVSVALSGATGWWEQRTIPDSFRMLLALAGAIGVSQLPYVLDAAQLAQTRVTRELRLQARAAIEGFVGAVLDHPANAAVLRATDRLPVRLWEEGLILVYRLLFILRLEGSADPVRAFSFASTRLWRTALSPNQSLGPLVRRRLDHGHDTGRMLEDGLRTLFRVFRDGLACNELSVAALGGALFGNGATSLLDRLAWGEQAVAMLLDCLLWTCPKGRGRERVHYGALNVEDLGRIYEALLELEPGIAAEPMVRLRRGKLEVVVPASRHDPAVRVESIPASRFFLRAGIGRKATGSYYTPHAFVRFLVGEALAPLLARCSPEDDPNPAAILALKVVDPATGSGHFLVEACRYLGDALYAACRLCDELASAAERQARTERASILRDRLANLPDPDRLLPTYLPSRICENTDPGISQDRALAICRRLVAVHCLYGADRNRLAVELAKLSLWLESYAEGLPLTFLDHRLVQGDSLAGPFFARMARLPVGGRPLDPLLAHGVHERLDAARAAAMNEVRVLEASVGRDVADLLIKGAAKQRMDAALEPLRALARAWSGAVMLALPAGDDEWLALAVAVVETGTWPGTMKRTQAALLEAGRDALPWDLTFPEAFQSGGFDAVLGNPPWDVIQYKTREFVAGFDLDAATRRDRAVLEAHTLADPGISRDFAVYRESFERQKRLAARLYRFQRAETGSGVTGGTLDVFRLFAERKLELTGPRGAIGMLMPSAFHANDGSTAIRRLYLQSTSLDCCLSFENRRKLFDIDSRFRFDLLVARRPGPTRSFRSAFYLDRFEQITDPARLMTYDTAFIDATDHQRLTLLELRGNNDMAVARRLFEAPERLGGWCRSRGIQFSNDLHMTGDAGNFRRIMADHARPVTAMVDTSDMLVLHEGKTFHQYTDRWDTPPRYAVAAADLAAKPATLAAAGHYRLVFRDIARSSDERTMIAAIAPAGVVFGHTATVERAPAARSNAEALVLCALLNSHPFDWLTRLKAGTHLSLYLIEGLPVPEIAPAAALFLAHAALRLSCHHAGYAALWRDQLGKRWRKPEGADPAERLKLRAAIDAVAAHAYGLTHDAYQHVLTGFSHKSAPQTGSLCLAAFDALTERSLETFCREHDPHRDTPRVRTLARPVLMFANGGSASRSGPRQLAF
jgi:hypothetical protein